MHALYPSGSHFDSPPFRILLLLYTLLAASLFATPVVFGNDVTGELKRWHRVTVTFDGPQTGESASKNPFADYRLQVAFTHEASGAVYVVPGFYAADGSAAQTGAVNGSRWRVHFTPDREGRWNYKASFRTGAYIAIDADPAAGQPTAFDGASGAFTIGPTDKSGVDYRGKGLLRYVGDYHLQFAGTGEPFIKVGPNGPENLLAYRDFDGTYDTACNGAPVDQTLHAYEPHIGDWRTGDPTWQQGKGKGLIGALNYLSDAGVNGLFFLTYNIDGGDGCDVWPWIDERDKSRFDVSKLAQWEVIFSHMDSKGIMLHVTLSERQNARSIESRAGDGDELNDIRKLYYRELVARFGHHLALQWNLGEENTNSDRMRVEFANYIRSIDPYDHPITVHSSDSKSFDFYQAILGEPSFEATSLQADIADYNALAIYYRRQSAAAGRKWAVYADEQAPNAANERADELRKAGLWGNLMGGGAGVEWYSSTDLSLEDFRKFDLLWSEMKYARQFFERYLPFHQMEPANELTPAADDFVLATENELYAVYLPTGEPAALNLGGDAATSFDVWWYNPRAGGGLQQSGVRAVNGGGVRALGPPPSEAGRDWVVLAAAPGRVSGNLPPRAVIAADVRQGAAPLTVRLDGSASTDPDGTIVAYEWNFGDGQRASGEVVSHTYETIGRYLASLTVTDHQGGKASASITLNVGNDSEPVVSILASDLDAAEPGGEGNNARIKISRSGDLSRRLEVAFALTGSATMGQDFESLEGTVVMEPGESLAEIFIFPLDDDLEEDDETVTVTLIGSTFYTLEMESSQATVVIYDDDAVTAYEPIYRVNAGGGGVSDAFLSWDRDTKNKPSEFVNAGSGDNFVDKDAFQGVNHTSAPTDIFHRQRWDPENGSRMEWDFPAPDARTYQVRLFFAETDNNIQHEGERVFDVYIEDQRVLENYDVFEEVGPQTATMKSFAVFVSDGNIDVDFRHVVDEPFVNGIEIAPARDASSPNDTEQPVAVQRYELINNGEWELIGVPLAGSEETLNEIGASNEVVRFDGRTYKKPDAIVTGSGYWMRGENDSVYRMEGDRIDSLDVELEAGWNLIAGPTCDVALNRATGYELLVPNTLYRFDGGYYPSHRLEQGRGYWVLARQPGVLQLGCGARTPGRDRVDVREEGFGQLIVRDGEGRAQILQFGGKLSSGRDPEMFELPPLAPAGGFDARFEGDIRLVEASRASARLQGTAPFQIKLADLPASGEREYVVTALRGGVEVRTAHLRRGDVMTLDSGVDGLRLQTHDTYDTTLPAAFSLEGNFPNPFNPETTLVFALPERARVEVTVYDMLGRQVMKLDPLPMDAAPRQELRINAGDLASGTYVYQVKAITGKRVATRSGTMVLLK